MKQIRVLALALAVAAPLSRAATPITIDGQQYDPAVTFQTASSPCSGDCTKALGIAPQTTMHIQSVQAPLPEPGTWLSMSVGGVALLVWRRRRMSK